MTSTIWTILGFVSAMTAVILTMDAHLPMVNMAPHPTATAFVFLVLAIAMAIMEDYCTKMRYRRRNA